MVPWNYGDLFGVCLEVVDNVPTIKLLIGKFDTYAFLVYVWEISCWKFFDINA